ncbi:PREDICTED: neuropeptide FF receptor 1-like isoform X2 [Nicrophorus vespilloides]|uniref:Neuropeptide FF receptor 1-like isoform X2 n=1 Tax=Nicrophorus vespilloides TaxID=110193 RepID=A0ABM1N3S4_NICVS|nr:PREDICTED: neuropeptide FF receptor 1-like isoform X2 [Nicrophorus vespilloides]
MDSTDYESIIFNYNDANVTVISLYIPIGLVALIANTLVIAVVIKFNYMRNVTNYFLVNLAVADLLVTIWCMPNSALCALTPMWLFDKFSCIVKNYFQCVCVACSVFTITMMAVDRYLAITRPFGFTHWLTKRSTKIVIAVIWIFSVVIFSPLLLVSKMKIEMIPVAQNITMKFCIEQWSQLDGYLSQSVFGLISFIAMFAVPGVIILYAYSMMGKTLCSVRPPVDDNDSIGTEQSFRLRRERKRVAWILLMLVLVFAICWLPYNTMLLIKDIAIIDMDVTLMQYMLLLGHSNSALNPIIYFTMSRNFRNSVIQFMKGSQIVSDNRHNVAQIFVAVPTRWLNSNIPRKSI